MTMPHLMNCAHSGEGWCLKCVAKLHTNPFKPCWPPELQANEINRVLCDDKGRNGGSWLSVLVDSQGDVWLAMQDWEDMPEGRPSTNPSIRIRTHGGGGQNIRTRQALLWLAAAIKADNEEQGRDNYGCRRSDA